MGHGKETPRQKMIGMMYLVLTAMLALNVSAEVLDAFRLVNEGIKNTTEIFSKKNETIYKEFEAEKISVVFFIPSFTSLNASSTSE